MNITDPRSIRNQRHNFITLIISTILSVLSGIDSFSGMEDYVECHKQEISKYFNLQNGVPSHDTFQRFWNNIDPSEFINAFGNFTKSLSKLSSDIINIDGKTIRNSKNGNTPLHIVSAWCKSNQLVLCQEKVSEKSNEIKAIPKLLNLLDLENKIVTIDAMGTQRDICQQIINKGGDYVMCLKGNQKSLYEAVRSHLEDNTNHKFINENNDKGHGRIEQRTAVATDDIDCLQKLHDWPGLSSIGMVKSHTTKIKNNKETSDIRYYIASLPLKADRLNEIARDHWSIENQLHWRLDVVFNEDKGCIRNANAAENVNILRKWALSILTRSKEKPSQSIKSVMRKNSMSFGYLINSVKNFFHA